MKLIDLIDQKKDLMASQENLIATCHASGRETLNADERREHQSNYARLFTLEGQIEAARTQQNAPGSLMHAIGGDFTKLITAGDPAPAQRGQKPMSIEYNEAFLAFLRSGGKQATSALSEGFDPLFGGFALPSLRGMSSAAYEGTQGSSNGAGGYAVSVPTDNQIVKLQVPDLGVRSLAMAIATSNDLKIPQQDNFATAGIKSESGASQNLFSESEAALTQFVLSAFMIGLKSTVSWELLQDVGMFQTFCLQGLIDAVDIAEDGFFVNGNGTAAPQGLVGNVGTGTGSPYAVESTGAYLLDSTIDVVGQLKGGYYKNAAFLMSRQTATAIRRAQIQANLFAPVWTREGGRDFLHGFPVSYSQAMPALPTATTAGVTPILFGSFTDGYLIGDRGGAGTFVKILDQPVATAGQTILLGYKRVDGRCRRSEAIQAITVSHS